MAFWVPFHGWMRFDHLDVCDGLTAAFTIGYRFKNFGLDEWTARFDQFKDGEEAARKGGDNMMLEAIPRLVEKLGFEKSKMAFVPALTSDEQIAFRDGVLSGIAEFCGEYFRYAEFEREAITKNPHKSLRTSESAEERRQILDAANFQSERIDADIVFIIDDFITTGETLSHIAQAIHKSNMEISEIYGIALGKNETHGYDHQAKSNGHVPEEWAEYWEEGARIN